MFVYATHPTFIYKLYNNICLARRLWYNHSDRAKGLQFAVYSYMIQFSNAQNQCKNVQLHLSHCIAPICPHFCFLCSFKPLHASHGQALLVFRRVYIVYIRCKQLLCWLSVHIRCSYNYNQLEHALLAMCVIGSLPYQTAQYIVLSMQGWWWLFVYCISEPARAYFGSLITQLTLTAL